MRQEFEMTDEELSKILDACVPIPYIIVGGIPPSSPQQRANDAWRALAAERGFDWETVKPIVGKGQKWFTAELVETAKDEQC